jgi:hypothetical protein
VGTIFPFSVPVVDPPLSATGTIIFLIFRCRPLIYQVEHSIRHAPVDL